MVEVSFVKACLQLSQGYVDVLKLFIVAVKAWYERGNSTVQLVQDLQHIKDTAAGRDLLPEEIRLRTTWIQAVNLMLKHLEHEQEQSTTTTNGAPIEEEESLADVSEQFGDLLPVLVRLQESRAPFSEALKQAETVLDMPESPIDKAIVTQTIRVLWYTMVVLREERLADNSTPRPNIPGTM